MANPSIKDIEEFGTFTNTLHKPEIAEDFLKHNNNSVEKAVDEWYTRGQDPNIYKNQDPNWALGQHGPANQMQAMPPDNWDWAPTSIHALGSDPLSRPPSPNTQGTKEHIAWAGQEQTMGNTENEDVEMQEALERSRRDQGTSTSIAVKILDPEPKERARGVAEEPAFLKPLPNGDLLPSLITILHSIPKCRRELLSKDDLQSEYKYNDHWWEGDSIEIGRVISTEEGSDDQPLLEIIYETQRLMAFLDRTNRAYGSAEALAKMMPINRVLPSEADYARFLSHWDAIAMSSISSTIHDLGSWSSMFTSKMGDASPHVQNSTELDEISRRVHLTSDHFSDLGVVTLYDALDKAIFGQPYEERLFTHEQMAPVFVIGMESRGKSHHVDVPSVFFADRYLEQNADFVRSSRTLIQEEMTNLDEITDKIARIETFRYPYTFRQGDASKLMSTAIGYLSERSSSAGSASVNGDMMDSDAPTDANAAKALRVLEQLEPIWNKLKERLDSLIERKRECEENIKSYSRCGTHPDDPQFPATVRYQLRGVATGGYHLPTITYAIYPTRKFGANGLLGSREEPQWWKMIYDTRYSAVIRKLRVSEKQVLEAACELTHNSLLVYAHDDFCQTGQDLPLPAQLKEFVEHDNAAFRAELVDDTGEDVQIIEGVPVDDNRAWHSPPDSDVSFGEPGPTLSDEQNFATDPTMMDVNEGVPEKVQEMEEIRREDTLSPKKRKADEDVDSDMETMAPDSDVEMDVR